MYKLLPQKKKISKRNKANIPIKIRNAFAIRSPYKERVNRSKRVTKSWQCEMSFGSERETSLLIPEYNNAF